MERQADVSVRSTTLLTLGAALAITLNACSGEPHPDGGRESVARTTAPVLSSPLLEFPGVTTTRIPPDTIGEVGPEHFVQAVNSEFGTEFAAFDKSGNLQSGPTDISTLFPPLGFCSFSLADPTVNYDHLADRWVLAFLADARLNTTCLAISTGSEPDLDDPSAWHFYQLRSPAIPDYQKIGVWPDAYYMTTFAPSVSLPRLLYMYALDRDSLLNGTAPSEIECAESGSHCLLRSIAALGVSSGGTVVVEDTRVLPADLDGPAPPGGTPGLFLRTVDDQQDATNATDRIEIWTATVDWSAQEWEVVKQDDLPTDPFDIMLCRRDSDDLDDCIPQADPAAVALDALSSRPMMALRYRHFGGHASMVVTQTVNVQHLFPGVAAREVAGKRWYELRSEGDDWFIRDQGDFSPQDAPADESELVHRWMGSAAMDRAGNIALGYSATNSDFDDPLFPAIRYTGRLATDAPGTMGTETQVAESPEAATSPSNSRRWGDYSAMSVDPVDGCTFWYTSQLEALEGAGDPLRLLETRIVSFRFDECGAQPVCILGENRVDLRDRVTATADLAAGTFLEIGAPATLDGNGIVGGNALIRSNGVVTGDLTLGGTLSTLGTFTIGGTLTENADPVIPELVTKTFATGSGFQVITGNTVLAPGNRGNVVVRPGVTLTLGSGTYNFASLNVETDVTLIANGTVEVNVQGSFRFGDRSDAVGNGLTVYSNGTIVRIGTDATFHGVLVAPNASVTVSSRTHIHGCVGGEVVTFDTDVILDADGKTLPTSSGGTTPPDPDPPTNISAAAVVQGDWGSGYCVHLDVTNTQSTTTTNWTVTVNLNGSIITDRWNGLFSGSMGTVTVNPGFDWNRAIAPAQTDSSVGFCASRPPGAGTAVVTSASGTF